MKPKNQVEEDEIEDSDAEDDTVDAEIEDRTRDYSQYKYIEKQLGDLYPMIEKGFDDKTEQNSIIDECWDMYHCNLNNHQGYVGNSEVYVPIVRDALTARETRYVNATFPVTGRYADVVGNDGHQPADLIAVLDTYVRMAKLRQNIAPALIRSGDISGEYCLYLDWVEHTRHVTSKEKIAEIKTELDTPVDGSPEYDDVSYEEVVEGRPGVMVLDTRNLCVLPATADSIEEAETVAVILRFSEKKIRKWIKDGMFEKKAGETLINNMKTFNSKQQPDTGKKAAAAAGITLDSKGNKVAMVYQVWTKLKIRGEYRMTVTHFGNSELILGCKRNPYWCDRVPVIWQAVEKNPDTGHGTSQVYPVAALQYKANDTANQGFDSAEYALLPIVMTDPEKNPRAGSMVLAMASVWLCDPNSTKFAEFPALWKDAFSIVGSCKEQIFQSLGVNPAMMPHGNAGKKPSQAQIAQEQQVALESTSDNVAILQEGVWSKVLEWFYELDYQYRDKAITVQKWGQLGLQADMDQVEPFQTRERYEFKWYGSEGAKAVQQVQQQISWMNVLKGIPPEQLNGRKVDFGPALDSINLTVFGPRAAPHILIDQRHQLTMSPEMENNLIEHLFPVQVHEMDDDPTHIQEHLAAFNELLALPPELLEGNQKAVLARGHILEHVKALKIKAAMAGGAKPGMLSAPGGAPGAPKPGAQAQPPTGVQNPPGAVSKDAMPLSMPRAAEG